jgi:hypothetical protein
MEMLMNAISYITIIVTVASFIAASTPTPKDDVWIGKLYKFIDLLALNIGKAKEQAPVVESKDGDS